MIHISRGQVDSSVIVGIVVVLAIVSAAGFGVYYVAFVRPRQIEMKETRASAMQSLKSLETIGTSQAQAAVDTYRVQVHKAESKSELLSVVQDIAETRRRENKRAELLKTARKATNGSFYSFPDLHDTLKSEINSKKTLSELESYQQSRTISSRAASAWQELLTGVVQGIHGTDLVLRKRNTPVYWEYMSKDNALDLIQTSSWQTLREMTFEEAGTYAIPIMDKFKRSPSLLPGSTLDIAVYDYSSENLKIIGANSTVLSVIFPKDKLGIVSWTLSDGATSYTYSTDVWEAIKAAEAGDPDAKNVKWSKYAEEVMKNALDAGVADHDLQALYVIEVPAQEDAKLVTKYEQYLTESKDVILLAHAS